MSDKQTINDNLVIPSGSSFEKELAKALRKPTKWVLIDVESQKNISFNSADDLLFAAKQLKEVEDAEKADTSEEPSDKNTEDSFDSFDEAFEQWKGGDRSEAVLAVMINEVLVEYQQGGFKPDELATVIAKAKHKVPLDSNDKVVVWSVYEYLEDLNFHSGLEALEVLTGIEYD